MAESMSGESDARLDRTVRQMLPGADRGFAVRVAHARGRSRSPINRHRIERCAHAGIRYSYE
jgi:hypothetical protein